MKELSIEDKAKRYVEALAMAKEIYNGNPSSETAKVVCKQIFPELKENEDDGIREWLIGYFKQYIIDGMPQVFGNGLNVKDVIAWLEKQGEQKPTKNIIETWKDMRLEAYQQASGNRHEPNYSDDNTKMFSLNDIDEIIEKMSEQKPTDKVEPKFKVDDWIVNKGNSYLIGYIDYEQRRYLFEVGGYTHEQLNWEYIENVDSKYHLWTIRDAKDGDVLLSPATPAGDKECPFIFKEIDEDGIVRCHVALLQSENLKVSDEITNVMGYANAGYHIPATKEQRELLFQKMKEAGYEWDAEKKELRKIKQILDNSAKTCKDEQDNAWGEEDNVFFKAIIRDIENIQYISEDAKKDRINWLKSLKERYTWKPSDEQMKALNDINLTGGISYAGQGRALINLYKELKHLKG